MTVRIFEDKRSLSQAAADRAAVVIRRAVADQGRARIVVATGTSQLDFLDSLTKAEGIDWQRVEMFHLDEYVGLPVTHPASFRKYLLEKFIRKAGITQFHLLDGDGDVRGVISPSMQSFTACAFRASGTTAMISRACKI